MNMNTKCKDKRCYRRIVVVLSSVCQSRFHGRLPHNNHNHNNNTIHENNASVIAFP